MKHVIGYFLCLLILWSCTAKSGTAYFEACMEYGLENGFPGIILAAKDIEHGKSWIVAGGYADIEHKIPMQVDERIHVGSVTKLITAMAVLKLIEEGYLTYETKVTELLTDSVVRNIPYIDQVTIRNLLNHTSGIYGSNNDLTYLQSILGEDASTDNRWTDEALLQLSDGRCNDPFGKPNSGTYYGDANYILLGLVVKKVTGDSLRNYVNEKIFSPLKLTNTGYYGEKEDPTRQEMPATVQGYIKNSKEIESIIKISPQYPRIADSLINTTEAVERIDGAAGVVSTATDMITLAENLYTGRLLRQGSLQFLMEPAERLDEQASEDMAQGVLQVFRRKGGIIYAATGDGTSGFHTILAYEPSKKMIIYIYTNIFGLFTEKETMLEIIDRILAEMNTRYSRLRQESG